MTPKEKAIELVYKYSCMQLGEDFDKWKEKGIVFDSRDKACALIAVDEVIEALHEHHWQNRLIIDYWEEVKHELEKL
jgi:hypothetical protein